MIKFLFTWCLLCGTCFALETTIETSTPKLTEEKTIEIKADGTKVIKKADGTTIELKPDGSKTIKEADGTIIEEKLDGSKTIKKADGTTINVPK